ncbi:Chitinase [Photobacterium marinum]|uniref:chitinase n=1 Tax=Photobacterium marinum TaxID=1056511 RepID=L8JBH3_9GAMM|nr:Ig-like domain-containing protein [Photobacterium marinum]ELR65618.1 Chitinase [Photobacterium marinum]
MQKSLITCALMLSFSAVGQAHDIDCSQLEQSQKWKEISNCDNNIGNIPPKVTLTSPLNNTQFVDSNTIILSAHTNDIDGSIENVTFLIDDKIVGTLTSEPFSLKWRAENGTHKVTTKVTDNQGSTSTDSATISVVRATGNQPPTVSLVTPVQESQLSSGQKVLILAKTSDLDGAVSKVDFYLDDKLIESDTETPFELNWQVTEGTNKFVVKATDNEEASTISEAISVTVAEQTSGTGCAGMPVYKAGSAYNAGDIVQNHNHKYRCNIAGWCSSKAAWAYEPGQGQHWTEAWSDLGVCAIVPEVKITAPTANSHLLAGSDVKIEANAADSDGSIAQVQFFAGNSALGTDTTAPYSANWLANGTGDIALKAVATDNEGNKGEASVLVSLSDQTLATSLTSPASGTTATLGKPFTLAATASSLTNAIQKVDFLVNGSIVATDNTAPYSVNWTAGSPGSYTVTAMATDTKGNTAISSSASVKVTEHLPSNTKHQLIGYWHNFVNGAGCPMNLHDISPAWDVIDIAFAENDRNSNGTVHFNLYSGDIYSSCPALDPAQFKQDIRALQAQGKKIVLSLGGAEGTITLNTDADEANFVSSLTDIIKEWGFDGLDIDLESGSNLLHGTQIQARLPRALKKIEANTGGNMYLTMAPEHPYVQGGMIAYSGIWGAYIPLIDELRDTLDLLHVQLYNNGGLANPYMPGAAPEGSVDMMVASAKMLVEGFKLANGTMFQPLRDDQVAIGLPSGPSSANSGQAPIQNIINALDCLAVGTSCGTVVPTKLYPNFGGVMTWSINWDQHDGYNFSKPVGDKLKTMNSK